MRLLGASKSGFSLIDLLISVAIIAILASIGIPKYNHFQAKAREAEAKVTLGAIFNFQKLYYLEYNATTNHLKRSGYIPEGNFHFNCGFGESSGEKKGVEDTRIVGGFATDFFWSGYCGSTHAPDCVLNLTPNNSAQFRIQDIWADVLGQGPPISFTAVCVGDVGGTRDSVWQINQDKSLKNLVPAF